MRSLQTKHFLLIIATNKRYTFLFIYIMCRIVSICATKQADCYDSGLDRFRTSTSNRVFMASDSMASAAAVLSFESAIAAAVVLLH